MDLGENLERTGNEVEELHRLGDYRSRRATGRRSCQTTRSTGERLSLVMMNVGFFRGPFPRMITWTHVALHSRGAWISGIREPADSEICAFRAEYELRFQILDFVDVADKSSATPPQGD